MPIDISAGPSRYGRIPHVYFYEAGASDDAAFGLLDIEIALQRSAAGRTKLELYCIGDGYQNGRGSSIDNPLFVELRAGPEVLAQITWQYPDVINGHMDPMTFSVDIDLSAEAFAAIDNVLLPATTATSHLHLG